MLVVFKPKWEIALSQIAHGVLSGIPQAPVVADAGYGNITAFRQGVREVGLVYMVGVQSSTAVWPEGLSPLPPRPSPVVGRPTKNLRRDEDHQPVTVWDVALSLDPASFKTVTWRQGAGDESMTSRFAALRVRASHQDFKRSEPHPEEWLLIEWPATEAEPRKFWLSSLPSNATLEELVATAQMRWRIERDYEELKGELGLDHFEGRSWIGFHHHATLCIAAYAFLLSERLRFSPLRNLKPSGLFKEPQIPEDFSPRGSSDPLSSAHSFLHRDSTISDRRSNLQTPQLPLSSTIFMTQ